MGDAVRARKTTRGRAWEGAGDVPREWVNAHEYFELISRLSAGCPESTGITVDDGSEVECVMAEAEKVTSSVTMGEFSGRRKTSQRRAAYQRF